MNVSIKFDTVKPEWFIAYTEGSQVIISKILVFLSPNIKFSSANRGDPYEMPSYVAVLSGSLLLHKYPFRDFAVYIGLKEY